MSTTMDIVERVLEQHREEMEFESWRKQLADARELQYLESLIEPEDEMMRRLR